MKIAYTIAPGRGDADLSLARFAERLLASGLRVIGAVQINEVPEDCHRCDMDLKILPDGPVLRISQSLGKESRGCRLDPEALEQSVSHVMSTMEDGADFLIVNKFGKHEAGGRGFREAIAEALSRDIPVLVGLSALNQQAFFEFTEGVAQNIAPDPDALWDWAEKCCQTDANLSLQG